MSSQNIRNTLRLQSKLESRPEVSAPVVSHIVKKASTFSTLAAASVSLETNIRNDRFARRFRNRKSREELFHNGVLRKCDEHANASTSSSLEWCIRKDAVSRTLRYRLDKEQLMKRGIIKYQFGNAAAFQFAAAQARVQRTLALRASREELEAVGVLYDCLQLQQRTLVHNLSRIAIEKMLKSRPSLTDIKTQGIMLNTSLKNSPVCKLIEKKLSLRPTVKELKVRNILKNSGSTLELQLKSLMLEKKLKNRPSPEAVSRFRPADNVDRSLAPAAHSLVKSFNGIRVNKALSKQPTVSELGERNITVSGISASVKALDKAIKVDKLTKALRAQPSRDSLVAKNILYSTTAPSATQAQTKALEFALLQLSLKSHVEARHSLYKINGLAHDSDFIVINNPVACV